MESQGNGRALPPRGYHADGLTVRTQRRSTPFLPEEPPVPSTKTGDATVHEYGWDGLARGIISLTPTALLEGHLGFSEDRGQRLNGKSRHIR